MTGAGRPTALGGQSGGTLARATLLALTQSTVGDILDMDQSEFSRFERRSDMLLSTLKRFVRATGGEMRIVVSYPDGGPVELFVGDE